MPKTPRQRAAIRRQAARNHKQYFGESILKEEIADIVRLYAIENHQPTGNHFHAFKDNADSFARFLNDRLRREFKVVRKARSQRTIH